MDSFCYLTHLGLYRGVAGTEDERIGGDKLEQPPKKAKVGVLNLRQIILVDHFRNLHVAFLHRFYSMVHVFRNLLPHTNPELTLQFALSADLRSEDSAERHNFLLNTCQLLEEIRRHQHLKGFAINKSIIQSLFLT